MTVDAADFERFARQLLEGATEIEWRNSASRMYYAAYHVCQEHAHRCPENSHLRMGSHEALIRRYALQSSAPVRSIAYILAAMKRIRCHADYAIDTRFAKDTAQKQMLHHRDMSAKLLVFVRQTDGTSEIAATSG